MKPRSVIFPLLCLAFALAPGCSRRDAADGAGEIRAVADLRGRRCGNVLGAAMEDVVTRIEPQAVFSTFNDYPSMMEALRLGKIDAVPMDMVVLRRWVANRPDEFRLVDSFAENPYGYFFQKGSSLRSRVNGILARMKSSGDLKRIVAKWCDTPDLASVSPEPFPHRRGYTGGKGTFRFATNCEYEPGAFIRDGVAVGFDLDIAQWIADELDMRFELVQVNMSALVPSVQSGKAEMGGGCITITAARAEKVDFSDCYLDDGIGILVRSPRLATGSRTVRTAADLAGRHIAHLSSDFHKEELRALQPDIVFDPYSEYAFAVESLRNGRIDAISLGKTYADIWMAKFPGEFRMAFEYADDVCCFLLSKNTSLKAKVDAELRRMNATGETSAIIRRWAEGAKDGALPALPVLPAPPAGAPEIRVAAAAQAEPWCFVADGGLSGIDIEILSVVAHRLGMRLQPKIYTWGGMVDCVNAGRCDIACGGIYTAGRTFPTVDASEKYADEKMCLLVRNEDFKGGDSGLVAFAKSLRESFIRTFVTESRWKMLANGFGITLLITFLSAFFGTALAFPVWLARTSRIGFVSTVARWYIAVLQGTPVLVLLMVLFYIVFGSVDIDGVWVAVIGFSLNASAYVGEMLRTGIASVPIGQTEAALALGYRPKQAFFRFVLPQAVRAILPVYRGELVSLLKSTAIVGYIAINDLTKASDLVRSRTYESFFPILTTAFIYFVAAWALAWAIDRVGNRLDPALRKGAAA